LRGLGSQKVRETRFREIVPTEIAQDTKPPIRIDGSGTIPSRNVGLAQPKVGVSTEDLEGWKRLGISMLTHQKRQKDGQKNSNHVFLHLL